MKKVNGFSEPNNSGINTYMLRLAEVYLNYVEAVMGDNDQTTDAEALRLFNAVRSRARMAEKSVVTYEDLRHEFRMEFAFEGLYWYQLLRRSYSHQQEVVNYLNNQNRNASYFNYGQPLLAVAAGTVITAVDGLPDQIPNENRPVDDLAKADGNHVILRLGPGVYAGYAHLQPGSVRVRRGQRVRPGQVLGLLGNSGNTSGPHLHFQLMTRPSLLDSDGLPFVVDRFRLDGHVPSLDQLIETDRDGTAVPIEPAGAGPRRGVGFTELGVVSFAGRSPR